MAILLNLVKYYIVNSLDSTHIDNNITKQSVVCVYDCMCTPTARLQINRFLSYIIVNAHSVVCLFYLFIIVAISKEK